MFRLTLLTSATAMALAGPAFAADLPSRAPPPVYVPPAPIFTWTGIYVGGQIGYVWGSQNVNFGDEFGFYDTLSYNASGVIGGAHVGYNLQLSQFVVGVEGDVDGSSINKSVTVAPAQIGFLPLTFNANLNVQGSIRGRVGYAFDRALIYATGGVAFGGVSSSLTTPTTFDTMANTRVGWTVGGGLEYAVTDNWSIRAEYRYTDFGRTLMHPTAGANSGSFINRHFVENRVQAGFSYKFDMAAPAPVVAKY